MDDFIDDSMIEMYVYEVSEMLPKMEAILIKGDQKKALDSDSIRILFRQMHTLKSSSRAMGYNKCSNLAHKVEDLFKFLENKDVALCNISVLLDIALECIDYFKLHVVKIKGGITEEDDTSLLISRIDKFLNEYVYLNKTEQLEIVVDEKPNDLKEKELSELQKESKKEIFEEKESSEVDTLNQKNILSDKKNINKGDAFISVRMDKIDALMNLVGELVITEPLVTDSREFSKLNLIKFQRDASRLHKMISEMQSIVMSIRMVTLASTMVKMNRVIHDMNKKFNKDIKFIVIGEDTEVDKNVIEKISNPLIHIIRNAVDHGIESKEERLKLGKVENGTIILEAKNIGSNVLISVKDDGRGLDKIAIYQKAVSLGLIENPIESYSDKEIFSFILLPGFTTNKELSEYSGRGIGMDVVKKNTESLGGSIHFNSKKNIGTSVSLKIPLLLSIIEGMNIRVNNTLFTIPIVNVVETFKASKDLFINRPQGEYLIKIRDELYPLILLNKIFNLDNPVINFDRGLIIVVEVQNNKFCIYADEIIGQDNVVAKSIPEYLQNFKEIDGISGCTIMRDGRISLILDCYAIINFVNK